eukprot:g2757.t1
MRDALLVLGFIDLATAACPPHAPCGPPPLDDYSSTGSRAVFEHASHVYDLVADGIEMAEDPPSGLFLALDFLNELRDFNCMVKYRDCFQDFPTQLDDGCVKLQAACERVEDCKESMASVAVCASLEQLGHALDRMAGSAAKLLWQMRRLANAPTLALLMREGSFINDACRPAVLPRRLLQLDGQIAPLIPQEARFLTSRVHEVLGQSDLTLPFIVNLGAGGPDVASCLLEREGPFWALLFEADVNRAEELRERYKLWSQATAMER